MLMLTGMDSQLGRRQSKDRPSAASVDRGQPQHIAEEGAGLLGIVREDDRVGARDHASNRTSARAVAGSLLGRPLRLHKALSHLRAARREAGTIAAGPVRGFPGVKAFVYERRAMPGGASSARLAADGRSK